MSAIHEKLHTEIHSMEYNVMCLRVTLRHMKKYLSECHFDHFAFIWFLQIFGKIYALSNFQRSLAESMLSPGYCASLYTFETNKEKFLD